MKYSKRSDRRDKKEESVRQSRQGKNETKENRKVSKENIKLKLLIQYRPKLPYDLGRVVRRYKGNQVDRGRKRSNKKDMKN